MIEYKKQLPLVTSADKAFWEAAKRHELLAYRCLNCGAYYSVVIDCVKCSAPHMEWVKVSGRGTVYTYTIYYQIYNPVWKEDIPYNAAWVQLEEGPLILTSIVGAKNEELRVGLPVEVIYDDVTEEVTLPKFKPV
jgi:uncharacterized protein